MERDDWAARRDPLLDRVYARGNELRRRQQMAMGIIAAAIVILIAVPAVALSGSGGSHRKVNTIGAPTTQSSEDTTTAPAANGVVTPVDAPNTTVVPTPTTARAATTTTTTLVCRNSYDPRCGLFRWDPAPVSDPVAVSVTYSPSNPKPGDTVTFRVTATNPNSPIGGRGILFGDGHGSQTMPEGFCSGTPETYGKSPHGPWDPPPKLPDHEEYDYNNVYDAPGTFTVTATVDGQDFACGGLPVAYPAGGSATATVTVSGPPVSTTTTTRAQ